MAGLTRPTSILEWDGETYEANDAFIRAMERARATKGDEGLETLMAAARRNGWIRRPVSREPSAPDKPIMSYAELPFDVRLEMMVGRMWDHLADTLELSERIKVRANASHSTRSHLAMVSELQMLVLKETQTLQQEVTELRRQLDERDSPGA